MGSRYRQQGARLFQLVLQQTYKSTNRLVSCSSRLLTAMIPCRALCSNEALTSKEERRRYEDMEGRMHSHCCGLIEVQELQKGQRVRLYRAKQPLVSCTGERSGLEKSYPNQRIPHKAASLMAVIWLVRNGFVEAVLRFGGKEKWSRLR